MKNKARLFGIYLPVYIFILLGAVTLKTIAALTSLNRYGYYENSVIINIAHTAVIVSAFFFLTYIITARRDLKLVASFSSPMNYLPAGLVSVALVFLSRHLFSIAKDAFNEWKVLYNSWKTNFASHPALKPAFPTVALISAVCAILAIGSIAYFIYTGIFDKRISARRANLGIVTLLFFSVYVAYIYFDINLPLNAPNKICDEMAYLSAALFFLYETRLSMGREKWRPYIAFGFIASIVTAFSSIPALIVYFADKTIISNTIYETLLTFTLFLFITLKLLLTGDLIEDKESPIVRKLIDAANEREIEIAPKPAQENATEEAESETDQNQITINDLAEEEVSADEADAPSEENSPTDTVKETEE